MKTRNSLITAASVCGMCLIVQSGFGQGSLTPPAGPPAPTMKSLDQVEPRTIINSANTPGDTANQFIISQPGSYYLTGNLVGVSGKSGIEITADNVTLDLNGFVMQGASSQNGISVPNAQNNITVRNGSIFGWGDFGVEGTASSGVIINSQSSDNIVLERLNVYGANFGIYANGSSVIRDCNCEGNFYEGITCAYGTSQITGCTAEFNGDDGIDLSFGTVSHCTADKNGGNGISCGTEGGTYAEVTECEVCFNSASGIVTENSASVTRCIVNGNDGSGIDTGNNILITGCTVTGNGGDGIAAGAVAKIADCVVGSNTGDGVSTGDHGQVTGCHLNNNTDGGIVITSFSLVRDNMVDYQEGTISTPGISATGSKNRIEDNNITRCGIGLKVSSTGNLVLRNSVSGSTGVNYSIAANNSVGVIVTPIASAGISGSSGGGIGSTDPTANFAY